MIPPFAPLVRPFLKACSVILVAGTCLTGCEGQGPEAARSMKTELQEIIAHEIQERGEGEVALYYRDLESGDSLAIRADERMHAASTMKVPVMIQLYADQAAGLLSLDDSVRVRTEFFSIVDGSPYSLEAGDDSDQTLYELSGQYVTYRDLIELMITVSSNLATNLLIGEVGAERVTQSMRALGADSIQVLRGVEDGPAFRAGLSNTTTARDLGRIATALARGEAVSPDASREMLEVLSRQHWRTKIPALLPAGTEVAHKTGRISGISHDFGVVFPPRAPAFALAVLTRGFSDGEMADALVARLSRAVFDHHLASQPEK